MGMLRFPHSPNTLTAEQVTRAGNTVLCVAGVSWTWIRFDHNGVGNKSTPSNGVQPSTHISSPTVKNCPARLPLYCGRRNGLVLQAFGASPQSRGSRSQAVVRVAELAINVLDGGYF